VLGPEDGAPGGGLDPVERGYQVVGLAPPVGERYVHGAPVVAELLHRGAVPDLDVVPLGRADQDPVQAEPGQRDVGGYVPAQRAGHVHDQFTVGIVEVVLAELAADREDIVQHAERAQRAQAVGRLVDADAVHG
jgi:hypothetical protein